RARTERERVGAPEQGRDVGAVAEQKHPILEAELANALLQERLFYAEPGAEELEPRMALTQAMGGLEKRTMALHRPEVADHRDQDIAGFDRQRIGRPRGERVECLDVHAVANDHHA